MTNLSMGHSKSSHFEVLISCAVSRFSRSRLAFVLLFPFGSRLPTVKRDRTFVSLISKKKTGEELYQVRGSTPVISVVKFDAL